MISPQIDKTTWHVDALFLAYGFQSMRYFPCQISTAFLQFAAEGDDVSEDLLLEQYLQYLPICERQLVKKLLNDGLGDIEEDEVLDFFTDHAVTKRPTSTNIKHIIAKLAHKEVLQSATYIAECWRSALLLFVVPLMDVSFTKMKNEITYATVWPLFIIEEKDHNSEVLKYFKRYVKSLASEEMKKLLRFCTGM